MKTFVWTLLTFCVTSLTFAASPDFESQKLHNWHQWRGPLANGVAPLGDPPTTWDEATNVKWKVKVPGRSTATPIVWGDQIFLITAIKTDREIELPAPPPAAVKTPFNIQKPKNYYEFVVMSVDRKSGQTQWQHIAKEEVPHEGHHPDGSYASASPFTDGEHIYVSFGSRGVYCYDLEGKQVWARDLGKMKIFNTFGEGCSPVVYGDTVIVNWDHQGGSFIIALDAKTGETLWKVDRDENTSWATPLVLERKGRVQVIAHGGKRVRSYDLKTGQVIWECGGQAPAAIPCPITDGNLIFAMTGYMGNALYAIPLDSEGDITGTDKIAWKKLESGTPYVPSPMIYDELLYFTGSNRGILSVLNAASGEPLIQRKRLEGISNIYASPVGAAGRVYLTSREGNTLVIKKGSEFEVLATNKLDDRFNASAAIVGKEFFLRGDENLYCIGAP